MEQYVALKQRAIVDEEVLASADATPLPAFPTGPGADGKVTFLGDFRGARIASIEWTMADLTTFTAADCTIQHSADGVTWSTLKAFTQKAADGTETIQILDTDPRPLRFLRSLIDMTGSPGTSTHSVKVNFNQLAQARGGLADGIPDRSN